MLGKTRSPYQYHPAECLKMMLRPLPQCSANSSFKQANPQCASLQQTAARQPLDDPLNITGPPQRLTAKPQRQSAVHKRSQPSQPKFVQNSSKWHPVNPGTPRRSPEGKSSQVDMRKIHRPALSKVEADNEGQPDSRGINHWLVDASSPEQILRIYAQHQKHFNIINLSTAFHRMAKVYQQFASHGLHCLHMMLREYWLCLCTLK